MTHYELSRQLEGLWHDSFKAPGYMMLRAVVELHKPDKEGLCAMNCVEVDDDGYAWTQCVYPCPTIQAIEGELNGQI